MFSACPRGMCRGIQGDGLDSLPLGREERWGNCKFCKIVDGNHGDITGIYPAFLKPLLWVTSSGAKGRIRAFTHLCACT